MSEFEKALHQEAKALSENLDGTAGQLLALTHAGYKAWAKEGNLHFPEPKRYALLHEILRYCAYGSLLECNPTQWDSLRKIAEMLDRRYPRYACTRARLRARRNRYGRPCV
ncbi:hypothetical protein AEMCBJ_33280 (plasmid) [Cupriavidus necator]|uniref:hypothetical protein n=1 Tax=Cupriavidus necator TaxID=106590 RepID=UPI003F739DC1